MSVGKSMVFLPGPLQGAELMVCRAGSEVGKVDLWTGDFSKFCLWLSEDEER